MDCRKLKWCFRQKKGIKLVKPSDNLCEAYLQKAKEALEATVVNANAGLVSWAVSASYYAKYFSVYALLSKIGIKSEIHDCTIEVFKFLFHDKIEKELINDLKRSKEERIETQYYLRKESMDMRKLIENTRNFVMKIEELISQIRREEVEKLRKKILTVIES